MTAYPPTSPRQRLVEAALTRLAEQGMRGLTHRTVEETAGMAQGSVRYHFESLDGLIEAVLRHLVEVEMTTVMRVDPAVTLQALESRVIPPEVVDAARESLERIAARPDLALARFELLLHCARHPELQQILRDARNEFVRAVGGSLPVPDPEAGARLILATVDGLALHQLSAHEPLVDRAAPLMLVTVSGAALSLPTTES